MAYSIREFRDADTVALLNIVGSVWGAKAVEKFNILHPWFRSRHATFSDRGDGDVVLETAGEVVGYLRLVPCEYLVDGHRIPATYFADNVTHPDHRGVGMQLARHVLKTPETLRIGLPVARVNLIWRRIVRPRRPDIGPLERCVLLLRPSPHLVKRGLPRFLGAGLDGLWQIWLRLSLLLRTDFGAKLGVVSSENNPPAPEELDAFFATFSRDFYGIAVRDSEFFRWRFFEACMKYRFLWLRRDGQLLGYTVYREALMNDRPMLLIIETMAIGQKQANYLAMLKHVIAHGLKSGATELQTINSGCKDFYAILKKLGMVSKVEKELLLAHALSAKPFADELTARTPWYLSLAESDNEFAIYPFTATTQAA